MAKALVPKGSVNTKEKSSADTSQPSDRRRLLGFILLVIAAFILLPEFKKATQGQQERSKPQLQAWSDPPAMFDAPAQVQPQEVQRVSLEDYDEVWSSAYEGSSDGADFIDAAALDASQDLQSEPQTAQIPEQKVQSAFIVQAGTFKSESNARDLVETLEGMGFRSFIKTQGEFHRVLVGPQLRRQEAEKALSSLAQRLSIKGMIKSYSP